MEGFDEAEIQATIDNSTGIDDHYFDQGDPWLSSLKEEKGEDKYLGLGCLIDDDDDQMLLGVLDFPQAPSVRMRLVCHHDYESPHIVIEFAIRFSDINGVFNKSKRFQEAKFQIFGDNLKSHFLVLKPVIMGPRTAPAPSSNIRSQMEDESVKRIVAPESLLAFGGVEKRLKVNAMWCLKLNLNRETLRKGGGFFCHQDYREQSETMDRIRHHCETTESLCLFINSTTIESLINKIIVAWLTEPRDPYEKFFPEHPTKPFLQKGQNLKSPLPEVKSPASLSFRAIDEYVVKTGYGAIVEAEQEQKAMGAGETIDCKLLAMTPPDMLTEEHPNELLGLLTLPEGVSIPQPNEVFYLTFPSQSQSPEPQVLPDTAVTLATSTDQAQAPVDADTTVPQDPTQAPVDADTTVSQDPTQEPVNPAQPPVNQKQGSRWAIRESAWKCITMVPAPYAPAGTATIYMRRPFDKQSKQPKIFTDNCEPRLVTVPRDDPNLDRNFFAKQEYQDVLVFRHYNSKPLSQQIAACFKLVYRLSSEATQVLLANNTLHLKTWNIYQSIAPEDLERYTQWMTEKGALNDEQFAAFKKAQCMQGPIGLVQGPPGTGKTHTLMYMALVFFLFCKAYVKDDQKAPEPTAEPDVPEPTAEPDVPEPTAEPDVPELTAEPMDYHYDLGVDDDSDIADSIDSDIPKRTNHPEPKPVKKDVFRPTPCNPKRHQILFVAPTNAAADILAKGIPRYFESFGHFENGTPNVIRVHPLHAERESYLNPTDYDFQSDGAEVVDPLETVQMSLFYRMNIDYYLANKPTSRNSKIVDSRITLNKLSLGHQLVDHITNSEDEVCRGFVQKRSELDDGWLEPEEQIQYKATATRIMQQLLCDADAVVCTLFSAGQDFIHSNIHPDAVFVDEAAMTKDTDLWPLLVHYDGCPIILFGDHRQLQPLVRSTPQVNQFANQLSWSPFARFGYAGLWLSKLRLQHRMTDDIAAIANKIFYSRTLLNAPSVSPAVNQVAQRIRTWNARTDRFSIESNVVFLDVVDAEPERQGTSFFNKRFIARGIYVCTLLLQDKMALPPDIVILCAYDAQYRWYRATLAETHAHNPELGIQNVAVQKIDSFQGGESSVVILDLTRTERLGFLSSPHRLNVALSRARNGLYVVYSRRGLGANVRSNPFISQLVRHVHNNSLNWADPFQKPSRKRAKRTREDIEAEEARLQTLRQLAPTLANNPAAADLAGFTWTMFTAHEEEKPDHEEENPDRKNKETGWGNDDESSKWD